MSQERSVRAVYTTITKNNKLKFINQSEWITSHIIIVISPLERSDGVGTEAPSTCVTSSKKLRIRIEL